MNIHPAVQQFSNLKKHATGVQFVQKQTDEVILIYKYIKKSQWRKKKKAKET
jgi:hypothetical protein